MGLEYPSWVYSIREDITEKNMKEYDRMKKKWYETAEKLYPDYWKMNLKERLKVQDKVNEAAGFAL